MEETAVAPVETAVVEATPSGTISDAAPDNAAQTTETDPALSALEEAMKAGLPAEEAAEAQPAAVAPEFSKVLGLSEFVKAPEHVESAIRAADEVWKVASGQASATSLLEGMRAANPEGFQKVINDLVPYIEQMTGSKFGAPPAETDPVQERLNAMEQRFAQEEQRRQDAIYQQQVSKGYEVAKGAVTTALKGTAFEGDENYVLAQCANKVGIPENEMVQKLLAGKTDELLAAVKAVQKDETARLKKYNENLIRNYRKLKDGVPATAAGKGLAPAPKNAATPAKKEGESDMAFAQRLWKEGYSG